VEHTPLQMRPAEIGDIATGPEMLAGPKRAQVRLVLLVNLRKSPITTSLLQGVTAAGGNVVRSFS
jgi:hypothetical protein